MVVSPYLHVPCQLPPASLWQGWGEPYRQLCQVPIFSGSARLQSSITAERGKQLTLQPAIWVSPSTWLLAKRGSSIMHGAISAKLGTPYSLPAIKAAAQELSW